MPFGYVPWVAYGYDAPPLDRVAKLHRSAAETIAGGSENEKRRRRRDHICIIERFLKNVDVILWVGVR